jgi:hypothetical protein
MNRQLFVKTLFSFLGLACLSGSAFAQSPDWWSDDVDEDGISVGAVAKVFIGAVAGANGDLNITSVIVLKPQQGASAPVISESELSYSQKGQRYDEVSDLSVVYPDTSHLRGSVAVKVWNHNQGVKALSIALAARAKDRPKYGSQAIVSLGGVVAEATAPAGNPSTSVNPGFDVPAGTLQGPGKVFIDGSYSVKIYKK